MKRKLHRPLTVILTAFFSLSSLLAWSQETTVYTDKADYLPGDTVLVLGEGWQPGEQVKLEIDHSTISHGNTVLYTIAHEDGSLQLKQYVIESYHLGEKFTVLATGLTSGFLAQTSFTDGSYTWNGSVSSDWHNGANWSKAAGLPSVPTESDDVIIPAGSSVVISAPAYCKSISFQPTSSKLKSYLAANSGLTVSGKLSIGKARLSLPTSATISGIVSCDSLISEFASANYSLIVEGTVTVSGGVRLPMPDAIVASPHSTTLKIIGELHVQGSVLSEGGYFYRTTEVVLGPNGSFFIEGDYVTLNASATTDMSQGGKLFIGREWKSDVVSNFITGLGTVIYNGNNDQVVKPFSYYNLTLAGSGTKIISGAGVNGKLSLQGTALASTVPNYGTYTVLEYKGSTPQTTGPEFRSTHFSEVIIDNPHGVILNEKKTIKTLTLVNGVVKTNGFALTLGMMGSNSAYVGSVKGGSATSYVEGKLNRVYANDGFFHFPIGKNGNYRPLSIRLMKNPNVSGATMISAEQFETPLAITPPPNTSLYSERHWTVTQSSLNVGTFSYDISLDGTGFQASGKPLVFKYDGSSVVSKEAAVVDNVFMVTNLNTFSSFAIGESSVATSIVAETPEAIKYGDNNVTLTATVARENGTAPVTSGTVEFFLDNKSVGVSQTLVNGKAAVSFDPSNLEVGSYVIKAQYRGDGTLAGSSSDPGGNGILVINKAPATITFENLEQEYDGTSKVVSPLIFPEGVSGVTVKYYKGAGADRTEVTPQQVIYAGTYDVEATLLNSNYSLPNGADKVVGTLLIRKATAILAFDPSTMNPVYTGSALTATASARCNNALVEGVSVEYTREGLAESSPTQAGTYRAVASLVNDNIEAAIVTSDFVIHKAESSTSINVSSATYDGAPKGGTASVTGVAGLNKELTIHYTGTIASGLTYNSTEPPSDAGTYIATAAYEGDDNHLGSKDVEVFTIAPAPAAINIAGLSRTYNGTAQGADVSTVPENVAFVVTYDGSPVIPTKAGSYAVGAALTDKNYAAASVSGILEIAKAPTSIAISVSSAIYDGYPHGGMAVVTGVADLSQVLTITYSGTTTDGVSFHSNEAPTEAGEYTAMAGYAESANYLGSSDAMPFVINKATSTVKVDDVTIEYDGVPHAATASVSGVNGIMGGVHITYTYVGTPNGAPLNSYNSDAAPAAAGTYVATASFAGNNNYESSVERASLLIKKAIPILVWEPGPFAGLIEGMDLTGMLNVSSFFRDFQLEGAFEFKIGERVVTLNTQLPASSTPYSLTAYFIPEDANNFEGTSISKPLRVYTKPVVTLSVPGPVVINGTCNIDAKLVGDITDISWEFSKAVSVLTNSASQLSVSSASPAVYAVYLTYSDAIGQSLSAGPVYAVFYDPTAGFVTGGGWITSPKVDELVYMKAEGKANFGFVSKYEKGKTYPSGNTEFQFQAGGMSFKSTAYEWLVISGARAQYKGVGTINDAGSYGFMLTAVDGDVAGAAGADLFRIKIWDRNNSDALVYDNQFKADDGADLTTHLGGGSIVTHLPSKKNTAVVSEARAAEEPGTTGIQVAVFPNPAPASFNVQLQSDPVQDKIKVRILDLYGRTVEEIPHAAPGQTYSIGAAYRPGIYFVEVLQGERRKVVKLLKVTE